MRPGDALGRFVIREDLGQGGMAGVFAGEERGTGRVVAIKTLDASRGPEQLVPRFVRECEVYRKLSHPNIVEYVASGVEGSIYYIVLEKVEGTSLAEHLAEAGGPLPVARALVIFQRVLDALEHAHAHAVIHRDVKPHNVMLVPGGGVKLLDFGIAAADDALLESGVGTILGTFFYASPEQNQGQKVDERTDLYSLGLVLWEMLTGRRALDGANLRQVATRQVTQPIPPPSTVNPALPEDLDALCMNLLQSDRTRRLGSAAEVRAALEARARA